MKNTLDLHCPHCDYHTAGTYEVCGWLDEINPNTLKPGMINICINCAGLSRFNLKMELIIINVEDASLDPEEIKDIKRLQTEVRKQLITANQIN